MPPNDRRARHKEQIRREILVAAGELFAQKGYESVSVRKIAERVEYSPAAIYLYFTDKADLLNQLCEETFAELIEHIHAYKDRQTDPLDGLLLGTRAYIEYGLSHPAQYIVTFISPPTHSADAPDIPFEGSMGQRCFQGLEEAIQACLDSSTAPGIDVKTTACTWWAAIHGLTSLLIAHEQFPWADREEMIENMLRTLVAGLLGPQGATAPAGAAVDRGSLPTSN